MCRISGNQFDPLRDGRKSRLFMCRLKGASWVQLTKQRNYLGAKTFPLFLRIAISRAKNSINFHVNFCRDPNRDFVMWKMRSKARSPVTSTLGCWVPLVSITTSLTCFSFIPRENKNKQIHKVYFSCFYTNINCGLCFLPEPRETRNDQQRRNGSERNPARIKPRKGKGEKIGKEPKLKQKKNVE